MVPIVMANCTPGAARYDRFADPLSLMRGNEDPSAGVILEEPPPADIFLYMPCEKPPMIPSTARHAKIFAAMLSVLGSTVCLAQQHSPTPFTREVESHFATWDRNHDGTLAADE